MSTATSKINSLSVLLGVIISLLPARVLAQAYGQCTYGGAGYAEGVCGASAPPPAIDLGPFGSLPVTGATIWAMVAIVALSLSAGLVVRARQRRAQKPKLI